jgi:uncharacterized membrane protein
MTSHRIYAKRWNNKINTVSVFLQKIQPHNFFLAVALFFGTILILITPVFMGPDEPAHFYTIARYSNGYVAPTQEGGKTGIRLQSGAVELRRFEKNPASFRTYEYHKEVPKLLSLKLDGFRSSFYTQANFTAYSPIAYAHYIITYTAGALLNINPFILFLLMRLVGLLVYIGLVFLAIKIIPRGKWLYVTLALLPMSLFIAGVIGADGLVIGSTMLLVAMIFNGIVNPKVLNKKYLLCLLGVVLVLGLSKQTFFLTSLLLFALPAPKAYRKFKWYLALGAIFLIVTGCMFVWYMYAGKYTNISSGYAVDSSKQLQGVLQNPFFYAKTVIRTYITTNATPIYLGFIGVLGWLNISLPIWITWAWLLVLFKSVQGSKRVAKVLLNLLQWFIFIIVPVMLAMMLTLGLYLTWTPVGSILVDGLQGRYFIPIIAILLPLLMLNKSEPNNNSRVFIILSVLFLQISTLIVYVFYYIKFR